MLLSCGTLLTFGHESVDFDVFIGDDKARVRFEFAYNTDGVRSMYKTEESHPGPHGPTMPTFFVQLFNLRYGSIFSDGPIRLGTVAGNSVWLIYEVTPAVGTKPRSEAHLHVLGRPGKRSVGRTIGSDEHRG